MTNKKYEVNEYGVNIKQCIADRGFTIKDVAEKLGKNYINMLRMLDGNLTIKSLWEIANTIGCSPADFFPKQEEDDNKQPIHLEKNNNGTYSFRCPHCGKKMEIIADISFTEAQ